MPPETELIPEALMVRVAERLRILGQPVRLRLIELLTNGPSTPQELSEALGLSQQNVSKHLLSLHRAGVVSRRPDRANVFYALTDPSAVAILRLSVDAVSSHLRELANLASGALPDADSRDYVAIRHLPIERGAK
jgi:ArsR family transcriptional regulator